MGMDPGPGTGKGSKMTTAQLAKVVSYGHQAENMAKAGQFAGAFKWLTEARNIINANNRIKNFDWETAQAVYFTYESRVFKMKRQAA